MFTELLKDSVEVKLHNLLTLNIMEDTVAKKAKKAVKKPAAKK